MPDPVEKAKDVASGVAHPVETTQNLAAEADAGRSARTPAIAITGVMLVVTAVLAVVMTIALVVYFVTK